MIKIAIVDDEQKCIDNIELHLNNYFKDKEFECFKFTNGNDLLNSEIAEYQIIFIDIEMPELDGITLANKVWERNKNVLMFFVTNYFSLITKALNSNAFTFIPKPIVGEDLFDELDRAIKVISKQEKMIHFKNENKTINLRISDISFVEVLGKCCEINLINSKAVVVNRRLHSLAEELKQYSFVQCHKSFIINLEHIFEIHKNDIKLRGCDKIIPMSRNFTQATKSKFNRFVMGEDI